jgi:hypothetical protein
MRARKVLLVLTMLPPRVEPQEADHGPTIPHKEPLAGTGTLEAAVERETNPVKRFLKVLGPGFITGASDDHPSGIGTLIPSDNAARHRFDTLPRT